LFVANSAAPVTHALLESVATSAAMPGTGKPIVLIRPRMSSMQ
jgi:hypothetical protein